MSEEKTFKTGRKTKKEELMQTIQEAQVPLIKALNENRGVMKDQQDRLKALEDNQTQFVKIIEEMRGNPGNQRQPGQNMPPSGQAGMGQILQTMIMRELAGGGQNPTKIALDLAREFNKTYMTGQRNMLKMLSLMSRKKSLSALLGEEGEEE